MILHARTAAGRVQADGGENPASTPGTCPAAAMHDSPLCSRSGKNQLTSDRTLRALLVLGPGLSGQPRERRATKARLVGKGQRVVTGDIVAGGVSGGEDQSRRCSMRSCRDLAHVLGGS